MTQWEYKCIGAEVPAGSAIMAKHHDPRARTMNWKEVPNWSKGPSLPEYFNQLGLEGWELVGLEGGVYWFKRPTASE